MDNYSKLEISRNATREEIESAYASLRKKYRNDMFLEGEAGNTAARKLTELDQAYSDIISERSRNEAQESFGNSLGDVDNLIRASEYDKAQRILDDMNERNGEWHYLQSIIYYKRNWFLESKKQLELAINKEPDNEKYRTALTRLENVMASPVNNQSRTNRGNENQRSLNEDETGNMNDCSTCCMSLCLADCCCNMMRCCG